MAEPGKVRCGHPFRVPAPAALRLTGRFPEGVGAEARTVEGTIEISGQMPGVIPAAADVFLVTDDRVVTMPLVQEAIGIRWAGETRTLPAVGSLAPCKGGAQRLPPGIYDLY